MKWSWVLDSTDLNGPLRWVYPPKKAKGLNPNFLAKTFTCFMACLPVTGFDEITKKPKWVEFKDNERLKVNY
jgi:hypothetical protein